LNPASFKWCCKIWQKTCQIGSGAPLFTVLLMPFEGRTSENGTLARRGAIAACFSSGFECDNLAI
jgi:hypothetical protein